MREGTCIGIGSGGFGCDGHPNHIACRFDCLRIGPRSLNRAGHTAEQIGLPGNGEVDTIGPLRVRSEEHTSELQSLMRISYAVFCLKKKTQHTYIPTLSYINNKTNLH